MCPSICARRPQVCGAQRGQRAPRQTEALSFGGENMLMTLFSLSGESLVSGNVPNMNQTEAAVCSVSQREERKVSAQHSGLHR